MKKEYSHVERHTKYMKIVFGIVKQNKNLQKFLDIPTGNGLLADKLRAEGHDVICGDKYKKKVVLPFLLLFILIGYFWTKSFNKESGGWVAKPDPKISNLFNPNLLFSRSLILVFEKE